jgi:SAM-dependent methyltransferase
MTWTPEKSCGYEVRKVRERVVPYLHGVILDVGCGPEKVCAEAIGLDFQSDAANIQMDISNPESLRLFGDQAADVVFSSHFLEDIHDYQGMLKEFWRILKVDGVLILYLPHKDLYPNVGQEGANPWHKHDFVPEDILSCLPGFVERNEIRAEDDEYSFELIIRKTEGTVPAKKRDNAVIVARYGGFGDMVIAAPLYRLLKEQGKYVIANCSADSAFVLEGNPHIDEITVQSRYVVPTAQLGEYFDAMRKEHGQVINLCETMERALLVEREKDPERWEASHEARHEECNINYSEYMLNKAGFIGGARPELYLTETEEVLSRVFREKHKGYFNIMWQCSGSSWHKLPPFTSDVVDWILDTYEDAQVFLTGGDNASILDWSRPRLHNRIKVWGPRQTMILTKSMDLVVSPETGVLNAAGAFDVPKIGLLTHSSKENLTKYFVNDYSIESEAHCSPCHKMIHELSECELDPVYGLPICMARDMPVEKIKATITQIYEEYHGKH